MEENGGGGSGGGRRVLFCEVQQILVATCISNLFLMVLSPIAYQEAAITVAKIRKGVPDFGLKYWETPCRNTGKHHAE